MIPFSTSDSLFFFQFDFLLFQPPRFLNSFSPFFPFLSVRFSNFQLYLLISPTFKFVPPRFFNSFSPFFAFLSVKFSNFQLYLFIPPTFKSGLRSRFSNLRGYCIIDGNFPPISFGAGRGAPEGALIELDPNHC